MAKSAIAVLGIDLGKNSCSLVGLDASGAVVLRQRSRRETIVGLTAKLAACIVAMEACCGAHHLGRLLAAQGHVIRLMSPEYVRPYVKAQKNDDRDAEAIAEAASRPTMRFVPLKAQEQLDMQSLHRVRSRLVGMRTMLMNQLRAILLERGLAFPQGRRKFETAVDVLLTDPEARVGTRIRALVAEIREEWAGLDRRIEALDREFVERARADEATRRLVSIPGVGPMTATALRAAVDDGSAFASARDLPAWLGLVPRQHTTGGRPKLLGISKRGNAYLRGLFIHGARAALASLSKAEDATGRWLRGLMARAHYNVVVVALAAKLARVAWATLRKGGSFERHLEPALA
jgi:transposase